MEDETITLRKIIEYAGRLPEYVLTIVIQNDRVVKCEMQELQDALVLQHLLTETGQNKPQEVQNS